MSRRLPNPHHRRPWHRGSVFGPGPRRPLDRSAKGRWLFTVRQHAARHELSRAERDVLEQLPEHLSRDGRCDPSYERLGADSGTCARTAQRAVRRAAELGLLRWQCRIVRAGWRAEQTSNAYELLLPDQPPAPAIAPRAIKLESCFTARESIAAKTAGLAVPLPSPGTPLPGFEERFAAKRAEERRRWTAN